MELEIPPLCVALIDLELGEAGTIAYISLPPADRQFLMRIGFVPGAQVRYSRRAPLGDPSVYSVDGAEIALRAETRVTSSFSEGTVRDWVICPDGHSH
jgi:Fe2+ transport system protein FeoA